YHSMYPRHARYLCVTRVRAPNVRAARSLETVRVVIPKEEVVVAQRICAQLRVIVKRTERQRCAASPTTHHLSCHQLLIFGTFRVLLQVAAELGHTLMQLAKDNVRAVAAQDSGHGLLDTAHLVRVTEHEIAGFERLLLGVTPGDAASLNGRMADAVPEPKRLCLGRQCVAVLTPDGFDSCHLAIGFPCAFEDGFKAPFVSRNRDYYDVYVASPQRLLPVFRCALARVAQVFGARSHSLAELPREAIERILRHTQGFEALVG